MSLPHEITQRDLGGRSAKVMDAVEHSEAFVVTRNDTAIGELIPLRRHRMVTREQFAAMSLHAPFIDAEQFRSDLDQTIESELQDPYASAAVRTHVGAEASRV